jgi:GntR family transcriptional repressor for pyruvate dehydrogenase complex
MNLALNKISKASIADRVVEQLLHLLLSGDLKLGDALPSEAVLATQLGVGRNSVREAMSVLQVLGMVERRQGDGTYIAENIELPFAPFIFTLLGKIATPVDLVEIRRVLEVGAMELVIEKATEEDIELLRKKVERFEALAEKEDAPLEEASEMDRDFHLSLVEATKNKALLEIFKLLMGLFRPSMTTHLASSQGLERSVRAHRNTFEAIEARDVERAREVIIDSFYVWQKYVPEPGGPLGNQRTD